MFLNWVNVNDVDYGFVCDCFDSFFLCGCDGLDILLKLVNYLFVVFLVV